MSSAEPINFSWVIPGKLAAHGLPESSDAVQYLWDVGIRHVVSLTPDSTPPIHAVPKMNWTHLGINKGDAPTMKQVETFVEVVEETISKEEALSVHCLRGGDRVGTMLACYLVKGKCITDEEAIDEISKTRPGSLNDKQEEVVKEYYQKVTNT